MSLRFVDLTEQFQVEQRRRQQRIAWNRLRRFVYIGIVIGFLLGLIVAALAYRITH